MIQAKSERALGRIQPGFPYIRVFFPRAKGLNLRISPKPGTFPIWCPVRLPQISLKGVGSFLLTPLSLLPAGPFRAPVLLTSKGYKRSSKRLSCGVYRD